MTAPRLTSYASDRVTERYSESDIDHVRAQLYSRVNSLTACIVSDQCSSAHLNMCSLTHTVKEIGLPVTMQKADGEPGNIKASNTPYPQTTSKKPTTSITFRSTGIRCISDAC